MAGFFIIQNTSINKKTIRSYQLCNDMLQLTYFFALNRTLIYFSRDK